MPEPLLFPTKKLDSPLAQVQSESSHLSGRKWRAPEAADQYDTEVPPSRSRLSDAPILAGTVSEK